MDFLQRWKALCQEMKNEQMDVYLINSNDPHQSAHVASHWQTVQWFTGFTGSVGVCVVTEDQVHFWSDSRYTIQAARELEINGIVCHTYGDADAPDVLGWISEHCGGQTLGMDGRVLSVHSYRDMEQKLAAARIKVRGDVDLLGRIWADRPVIPGEPMFELPIEYAGKPTAEKLQELRTHMKKADVQAYIASGLDDIAWLTNLRCFENPLHPLFHAYALIDETSAVVYLNTQKITDEIRAHLRREGIEFKETEALIDDLKHLEGCERVYMDPCKTGFLYQKLIPESVDVIEGLDLLTNLKAVKNEIEIQNLRECTIGETTSLFRMQLFLKDHIGVEDMDEMTVGEKIEEERK